MNEREIANFRRYVLPKYMTKPLDKNPNEYLAYLHETKRKLLAGLKSVNTQIAEYENFA